MAVKKIINTHFINKSLQNIYIKHLQDIKITKTLQQAIRKTKINKIEITKMPKQAIKKKENLVLYLWKSSYVWKFTSASLSDHFRTKL